MAQRLTESERHTRHALKRFGEHAKNPQARRVLVYELERMGILDWVRSQAPRLRWRLSMGLRDRELELIRETANTLQNLRKKEKEARRACKVFRVNTSRAAEGELLDELDRRGIRGWAEERMGDTLNSDLTTDGNAATDDKSND